MAGPITWRSVQQDNSGANRLLAGASNALNGTTNTLLNVLGNAQKQAEANDKLNVQSNTQDYLDKITSMTGGDPDKLADPGVQKNIEALRTSYGNNIDRQAAREALPSMLAQAQKSRMGTLEYNVANDTENQRGTVDQYQNLLRSGDLEGAQKILDTNDLRGEDRLTTAWQQSKQNALNEGRAVEDQNMQKIGFNTSQAAAKLGMEATRQSINFGKEDQKMQVQTFNDSRVDRAERRDAFARQQGNDYADGLDKQADAQLAKLSQTNMFIKDNADPVKSANDMLKELPKGAFDHFTQGDEAARKDMQSTVRGLMVDGVPVVKDGVTYTLPVPADVVKQGLDAVSNNWGAKDTDLKQYFTDMMKQPEIQNQVIEALDARAKAATIKDHTARLRASLKPASLGGKTETNLVRKLQKFGKPEPDDDIDDSKSSPY